MNAINNNYDCLSCGCCCLQVGVVPFSNDELKKLPKQLFHVWAFFWKNDPDRSSGSPCYFFNFKTGKCAIYNHRPKICRDYQAGGEDCRRIRYFRFAMRWQFQLVIDKMPVEKLKDLWNIRQKLHSEFVANNGKK